MKHNWLYTLLAVAISAAVVLTACGPVQTPAPEATAVPQAPAATAVPPTEAPPAERKVATFIWTQEFDTLNPLYTNMWFSAITFQFWSCYAWDFDDVSAPHPVLVSEMPTIENGGISADGSVITLKLRDDIVWSDGTPITSEDFLFTHEMTMSPQNAVATTSPNDQLASLEAPDERTVVMTFNEPYAAWQGTFWKGILPAHILRPVFEADGTLDNALWSREPTVGCGPFVFDTWESGSYARFVANENYWLGRPKIDELFVRFVPDDASQVAALQAGEGDLGTFIAYSDIPTLEEAGVKMVNNFSGYNEGIYFYQGENGHPAVKDVKVRQAIALATDRQAICDDLLLGLTEPAATDWDVTPWVDPEIKPWPYDPEQAKALLDEAGWVDSNGDGTRDKDGVELVLDYGTTTREIRKDTQAVFQQQLAAVGIGTNLLNAESDLYFSGYGQGGPCATGEYDFFEYSSTVNYPDPHISEWMCDEIPSDESPDGTNWQAVCDPELDALFKKELTQVDFTQRQQTFYQITRMIFEKVYFLGIWQDPDVWAVGPRLQNVKLSGATPFFNIIEWDLAQ